MSSSTEFESLRPLAQAVHAELARADEEDRTHKLVVLAASVCVFVSLEWVRTTLWSVLGVLAVLLLHEAGHYVSMRLLRYRNRRIYFLPVYGGNTVGEDRGAPATHRVLVAFSGPLPGILVGCAAAAATSSRGIAQAAELVLLVNVFNLLPFLPLDGGHIWHQLLFCRSRRLESGFLLCGTAFLLALAVGRGEWVLALLGALMAWKAWYSWRVNLLAEEWRAAAPGAAFAEPGSLEPSELLPLLAGIRRCFPRARAPRAVAARARDVTAVLSARPPGPRAMWLLAAAYFLSIALAAKGLQLAGR